MANKNLDALNNRLIEMATQRMFTCDNIDETYENIQKWMREFEQVYFARNHLQQELQAAEAAEEEIVYYMQKYKIPRADAYLKRDNRIINHKLFYKEEE